MFKSIGDFVKNKQGEMIALLRAKRTAIEAILQGYDFCLFGDYVPNTAPGMAAINIIIADDVRDYMKSLKLQKQLTELLWPHSVNIYTPRSMKDTYKDHAAATLVAAKTLAEIIGEEPTLTTLPGSGPGFPH